MELPWMKLGFPIWYGYGERIWKFIDEAEEAGFNYLEISLDYPWPFRGKPKLGEVVRKALDEGFSIAFHAPWRDIRPASPIEEVRNSSVAALKKFMSEVAEHSADYIVLHLSTDQAVDRIPEIGEESINAAVESIKELKSFTRSLGLRMVVENVREDLHRFKRIVLESDSEVCLDVSHAICSIVRNGGRGRIEEELITWITELKDRVKVLHFSGVKFMENRVKDHFLVDENDHYLKLVKKELKLLNIENFLLECFEDPDHGEVTPMRLAPAVKFLKS